MPTPLRRRLRMARRGLGYTVAVSLVLVAMLLGVASQLLPFAERNPDRVASWLSERAGRPVAFDRVQTRWTRRGPLLQLDNLRIGNGAQGFTIGDTEMLVSLYAGLLPGQSFSELRLRGLDLTLERADDGRWRVRGLPGQQASPDDDPFAALEGLGELQVIDGRLAVIAPSLGIDARVPQIDLRLRVDGDRVRAGMRAWPRAVAGQAATPLDAVLDFDRKRGDGRAYAGARRADLAAWSDLMQVMGIAVEAGHGRAEAWADLRSHRVAMLTLDAALDDVALRGNSPLAGKPPSRVRFDRVETLARWRLVDRGWRIDASRLRIGAGKQPQMLDGLIVAGGARYAVLAREIDAAPLLAVAALSDRVAPGVRQWLQATRPDAKLQDIEIAGVRGGPMRAHARIASMGFAPVGSAPGVSGLAGTLDGDAAGLSLQLDPGASVRVDWPRGFGVVHAARLSGTVTGWREASGWRIATPALRIAGEGFGADVRGGLQWQGDGSLPRIDLAAAIDDTDLPKAREFWVRHVMPPSLVAWLDDALVAGTITQGRALVSGDLDEWPFAANNGRFEASAHIGKATLKYRPDWPAATGIEADTRFVDDGFTVKGTGALAGVRIDQFEAGIDHYRNGTLTVQARGGGDASQLLGLLRQSPLQKAHADTFASLSASGSAAVAFALEMPLAQGSRTTINGHVALDQARLEDRRWKLAFDQVSGRAEYSQTGFHGDGLRVRHQGQPGRLSLRAGDGHVRDRGNAFEAGLDATLSAGELLDRAENLAWLKPYFAGRSPWTVGIVVPKAVRGRAPPARLQLRSDLVGTALTLPAPLDKAAGLPLAATVDTPLPLGSGEIRVGLGRLMGLRARSGQGQTGVRIELGSGQVALPPPINGLVASGRATTLDALDWIALARSGSGGSSGSSGGGLPLQRIDVTAQRLQLLGGAFANTRVSVVPAPAGALAVRAEGLALEGSLLVPASSSAAIAGRFQRVHWRSAKGTRPDASVAAGKSAPAALASPAAAPAPADVDDLDPARIPPLTFDIDDLRIADTRLGSAKLRTRPSAAGMRIEQFQTRIDKQAIDISGDWTQRGAVARTQVDVRVDSEDFGALLGGFGFPGRLAGGDGRAQLNAGWAGSPAEFQLAGIDGSLTLAARDGRLLEVEPGAGRVLGLLSLAELPRRLSLDFRDFFAKGFAFNRIDGVMVFAGGSARSDNLVIDGPAAAISIRGAANLRAQSFDQTIEVRPKAGNLLTAVGAIAGGPVGAAIGAAANAVLQKPLGQIGAKTYRVTGPWADPKVEVISREQGRVSATRAPPAG